MAVRIVCASCRCVMNVADELRGKKIRCKDCSEVVAVPDDGVEFAERPRLPAASRRRDCDEDDDDERFLQRRGDEQGPALAPILAAAAGGVVLLVIVVVIIVLAAGADGPADENLQAALAPNEPAGQAVAQVDQGAPNAPANNAALPKEAAPPPLLPAEDLGPVANGEQIYQRMLRSTVWIVASHKIVAMGGNRPLAQGPADFPKFKRPPFPRPPGMVRPPNFPNFPQPGLPMLPGLPDNPADLVPDPNQQSTLTGSVWVGRETLAGFGKLTFQFTSNVAVVMIDAQEQSRGNYRQNGNAVIITFGGGIIYNGNINGNIMSGNATNGQQNWNWNVIKGGAVNQIPGNPGDGIFAKATGSGSLIDRKHRLVVTNVHVVGNADTVTVYFPEFDDKGELIVHSDNYKKKPGMTGKVIMREPRADLAFIQLQQLPQNSLVVPLSKAKARPAQQVHSVGNPGASKGLWIYSPGKVRQVFQDKWKIFDDLDNKMCEYDAMKLETDSAINAGDSGGPLVNDRAAMVGVAHGHSLVANNISVFIEVSEVRTLLERYYKSVNDTYVPEPQAK
jgi:S1-C subfamily serine protease